MQVGSWRERLETGRRIRTPRHMTSCVHLGVGATNMGSGSKIQSVWKARQITKKHRL
jgi:hypothetical protein